MLVETLAALASSLAQLPAPQPAPGGVVVMPRSAAVTQTTLDGADGRGVWLWHKTIGYGTPGSIRVADRPAYPSGRADSVRRPGFNGQAWRGETCIGGVDSWAVNSGEPGATAYGASGDEGRVAHLRVGQYVVGVNPFEEIRAEGKEMPRHLLSAMEDARNDWLKQNGYVGGVRSFTNDAAGLVPSKQAIDLTPKAVIPSPIDLPKTGGRMQVNASRSAPMIAGATRVSLPPNLSVASMHPPVVVASK